MKDVLSFAAQKASEGERVALISVIMTNGSSPASPGQLMAVLSDGSSVGTVGGGASEHKLILMAVEAIKNGERIFEFSFDHSEDGMVCGGGMTGFGNVIGNGAGLIIFGGGHVAQSLALIAAHAGFGITVVEDRAQFASSFENVKYTVLEPREYDGANLVSDSDYVVICTRGHSTDDEALRYCLKRQPKYIGMIGSEKKVTSLFETLRKEGVSEDELAKIYAPIGLDIASEAPSQIAVAILAEILLIKNNGSLRHRKLRG